MAGDTSKKSGAPGWYAGLDHIWLPYAQMKTTRPPLPVARTQGSRIILADGRELIDGVASWWTACHGYNHPHIRQAVERQLGVAIGVHHALALLERERGGFAGGAEHVEPIAAVVDQIARELGGAGDVGRAVLVDGGGDGGDHAAKL